MRSCNFQFFTENLTLLRTFQLITYVRTCIVPLYDNITDHSFHSSISEKSENSVIIIMLVQESIFDFCRKSTTVIQMFQKDNKGFDLFVFLIINLFTNKHTYILPS